MMFDRPLVIDDIEYTVILETRCFNKSTFEAIAHALIPLRLIGCTDEEIKNHFIVTQTIVYSGGWQRSLLKELKKIL